MRTAHLIYCPFTGLGLFGGFRGKRWLQNRIKIFKQFVVPSLEAQTCQNFILWCSWRPEEKDNPYVKELKEWLGQNTHFQAVFTFYGVCFWDDKHREEEARERLFQSLRGSGIDLINFVGDSDYILMTLQPSDDCYNKEAFWEIQKVLKNEKYQAVGYSKGYICNYQTKELAEYTPNTNPPFYTIKFSRNNFLEPLKHLNYTSLKKDVGQYKKGTPLPSHEYVKDCLNYRLIDKRGFLVGCHGENISTYFNHPFKGKEVGKQILEQFGLEKTDLLEIKINWRKVILKCLPFKVQRKLRYWLGELLWQKIYEFLRG